MRRPSPSKILAVAALLASVLISVNGHSSDIEQRTSPNWPASYPITGNVNVANFPSSQTVTVSNFPANQTIVGTVTVANPTVAASTVSIVNFPAVQQISGTVAVSNSPPITISSVTTVPAPAFSCSISSTVSIALVSVQIVPANPNRKGIILYNNSANSVYIAYDTFSSSANHMTFLIPTFASWTMPYPLWLGAIAGIRNSGTGAVIITELQ